MRRLNRILVAAFVATVLVAVVVVGVAYELERHTGSPFVTAKPALDITPHAFHPDAVAFCRAVVVEPLTAAVASKGTYAHAMLGEEAVFAPTPELRDALVDIERSLYLYDSPPSSSALLTATQSINAQCGGTQ